MYPTETCGVTVYPYNNNPRWTRSVNGSQVVLLSHLDNHPSGISFNNIWRYSYKSAHMSAISANMARQARVNNTSVDPNVDIINHIGFCEEYINGLVQYCSISSALAMEILQPCTKPSTFKRSKYALTSAYLLLLTHWGRDKMAAISQTTLSNAFSWMKVLGFRLNFHWSLFLRVQLTIFQHWFR